MTRPIMSWEIYEQALHGIDMLLSQGYINKYEARRGEYEINQQFDLLGDPMALTQRIAAADNYRKAAQQR